MRITLKTAKLAKEKDFEIIETWARVFSNSGNPIEEISFASKQECDNAYKSNYYLRKSQDPTQIGYPTKSELLRAETTQSELQKWLREVHNTHIKVYLNEFDLYTTYSYSILYNKKNGYFSSKLTDEIFDTYEEALETGLFAALNLI